MITPIFFQNIGVSGVRKLDGKNLNKVNRSPQKFDQIFDFAVLSSRLTCFKAGGLNAKISLGLTSFLGSDGVLQWN